MLLIFLGSRQAVLYVHPVLAPLINGYSTPMGIVVHIYHPASLNTKESPPLEKNYSSWDNAVLEALIK